MLNSDTKRHIDAARDVLVGVAPNPTTQIDQITYALIYKFMDDMDQASVKAGGEASFFVGDLEKYAWSNLMSTRMGNQEKMDLYSEALTKFSEAKQLPELFRTIFRAAFLPYRSPETLGLFLKEISYFDYTHPEELGNAYEYLLSIMSSQGDAGQFRTPRHIIDFIVDVINPTKDDKVLDPACGTGGFLVSTYNHILEQHDGKDDPKKKEKPLTPDERKKLMSNLQGYDIDPTMVRIAQVNMYLHQFKNPQIFQYDSLTSEERWNDKYDVILANPPFMSPKGGIKPHNKFGVASNRAEVLFVDYIISHLKPKGRAGIVVPEGIVFQSGSAYKELRKNLVENGLYAVASLPSGVFQPYSGVKTSILFFNKELAKVKNDILFVKISADGFHLRSTRKTSDIDDLPEAQKEIAKFSNGVNVDGGIAFPVLKSIIAESGDYYLSSERYQPRAEHIGAFENASIGQILQQAPTEKVGNRDVPIMSITMAHGLIDQGDKFKRRIASDDISNYKLVKKNNLVVGFPIDEGVLGFLQKYDYAAVSPAYGIWEIIDEEKVNIDYLETILRSSQMRKIYAENMQGAVSRRRSVPKDVFVKLQLPLPPLEIQEKFITELRSFELVHSGAKSIVENWKPKIELDPNWDVVTLGEIVDILDSKRKPITKSDRIAGPYPYYGATGILDYVNEYIFSERLILLGEDGAKWEAGANSAFIVEGKYWVNNHAHVFRAHKDKVNDIYLVTMLNQMDLTNFITGVTVPKLNQERMRSIEIPLPSLEEQSSLANEIETERVLVESARRLMENYQTKIQKHTSDMWSNSEK